MDATNAIFYIAILVMSIVIHEVSHGFMAEYFGDTTARYAGRLTLNPIKHLDIFGSIILPVLLVVSHSPVLFGWAKPVPYNPDNLTNRRWGELAVASAGVIANIFIAILFGLLIRFTFPLQLSQQFYDIISYIVLMNLALAIFNLVPIPPLDGSKILASFLPRSMSGVMAMLEQYGLFILVIFIVYFADILVPIILTSFTLITGLAF